MLTTLSPIGRFTPDATSASTADDTSTPAGGATPARRRQRETPAARDAMARPLRSAPVAQQMVSGVSSRLAARAPGEASHTWAMNGSGDVSVFLNVSLSARLPQRGGGNCTRGGGCYGGLCCAGACLCAAGFSGTHCEFRVECAQWKWAPPPPAAPPGPGGTTAAAAR